ncbi:MAG: 2-hydroxychromene-2-carboxylate isomerase [Deltaproteobacteria bacterium]|nr:2-hydroxychromene-2-carboxylate isomerase [Nannocystaceae bacterium]
MSAPRGADEIRFYFDVVCPYAYLASLQIDAFAAEHGARVRHCPVLLGGLLRAFGGPDDPNRTHAPARGRMTRLDIARSGALHGRVISVPAEHPRRTLDAMRLVIAAPEAERIPIAAALFAAYWQQGLDVANRKVLAPIASAHGVDIASIDDDAVKQELRARTEEAAKDGAFGVPTFVVGEHRVWGQDRLDVLARALGAPRRDPARVIGSWPGPEAPAHVRFFHDVSSPFSYLASTQIERVCAAGGASFEAVPILLGALFREIGTADVPMFEMHAAKQAWVRRDLDDWAALWDVPLRFPTHFPIRSVLPQRVMIAEPRTRELIYRAAWVEDRRVDDRDALAELLGAAGFPAGDLLARAESDPIKAALREHTAAARTAGACGVPSFEVSFEVTRSGAAPVLLWGQDRLGMLASTLAGFVPPGAAS